MAKISIKTDFADGDKLFAQQLNLNFKTIEAAFDSSNKIVWEDTTEEGTEVKFKRYITTDIDSLPIEDGAVIYDVTKGRHYIDYLGERIQVGSAGNEIVISETEPTHEDTKLWINPEDDDILNVGTEVTNDLASNSTTKAPSCKAVNDAIEKNIITVGSNSSITITGGVETKIPLNTFFSKKGNKFELVDGNIKIGKEIKQILINAQITYSNGGDNTKNISLYKNDEIIMKSLMIGSLQPTIVISPKLIDVKEGDILTLKGRQTNPNSDGTITSNSIYTYVTIKEV